MKNTTLNRRAFRAALLAGAASVLALPAVAQQEAQLEEIVVTGSRIKNSSLTSISPLTVIGAQDIDVSAATNIQTLLLKNPPFGSPAINRTNSNFATSSSGVATIDLRDLGTARTLVLVNGRRYVSGVPGSAAVDLNTIPTQFVERVEVLTGGASAVYGSDAVAGVVNIIYRQDFEGVEAEARYGGTTHGDGIEKEANLTIGANFGGDRGNVVSHLSYTNEGAVYSKDRDFAAIDQASTGAFITGELSELFDITRPFFSSFAPQGRFFAGADQFTYNAQNQLLTGFSTNGSTTRSPDGFNRSEFRTIAVPTERFLFASRAHYDISDNVTAFMEGTYAATHVVSVLEPFPLGAENIFPDTGGQWNIESESFAPDPLAPGRYIRTVLRNPIVPLPIYNAATDTDGDGLRDIYFSRRLSEVGNRGSTADRGTFRFLTGLEGAIPGLGNWTYETYFAYGETVESQISNGQVNVLNFAFALDAVPDLDDIDGDGNTAEAICRSATAREFNCVPANVFGFGSLSPEAIDYVTAPSLYNVLIKQQVAGVNLTGDLLDLPAGPLGVAVGGEWRSEYSRAQFDPLQQAGLNAGNAIPPTVGRFSVWEGYVEAIAPLLSDQPFARTWNLRGALRMSDYSTVGSTTSWNAGTEWAPNDMLRLRVVRSQSVRAPDISELYSPPSQDFPTGLNDPCLGVTAATTGTLADNCRAAPGVNANIAANGSFIATQADLQGISGYDRGNPLLQEEKGKSWTIGAVLTPSGVDVLEDFSLTVDYFKIDINDAIVGTPRQFILDQCYAQGNADFCQFITRRPAAQGPNSAGSLEFIDTAQTNSGGLSTQGIDFTLTHNWDLGTNGSLDTRVIYTRLLKGSVVPAAGSAPDKFAGEVNNGEFGTSKDKVFLNLAYNLDRLGVFWSVNYIGPASLDDQFLAAFGGAPGSVGIGAEWYHDVQVRYQLFDSLEAFVGADNLFDNKPPPIISGLPGNITGTETAASDYDAIGMLIYGGVKISF